MTAVLAGAAATLAIAALLIHFTAGLGNYLHWTIVFAGQRRLPGWADMLGIYRDPTLLWTLPCIATGLLLLGLKLGKPRSQSSLALALLAAPFIYALYSLILYDDADERGDSLLALWPLLLILAAALAISNLVRLRHHLNLRLLHAHHSACRHSWHLPVPTALGIDLCHLAAPQPSAGEMIVFLAPLFGCPGVRCWGPGKARTKMAAHHPDISHRGHAPGFGQLLYSQRRAPLLR